MIISLEHTNQMKKWLINSSKTVHCRSKLLIIEFARDLKVRPQKPASFPPGYFLYPSEAIKSLWSLYCILHFVHNHLTAGAFFHRESQTNQGPGRRHPDYTERPKSISSGLSLLKNSNSWRNYLKLFAVEFPSTSKRWHFRMAKDKKTYKHPRVERFMDEIHKENKQIWNHYVDIAQ